MGCGGVDDGRAVLMGCGGVDDGRAVLVGCGGVDDGRVDDGRVECCEKW